MSARTPYERTFLAIAVLLLCTLAAMAPDFGATWDEPQQRAKALRLISYVEGHSALDEPLDGAHLYGAPFDVASALIEHVLPMDAYVIRHEVIAVVGWLGILLCGLLADRLFGPPHGVCSMLLLAASPFYMAHAINNPKDLPFATVATAVLLGLTRIGPRSPVLSWGAVAGFAALIGLGLNVRPGALIFAGYVGVVVLYRLLEARPVQPMTVVQAGLRVALVLAGAVAVGWIAWPWAYAHPLSAPFRAMSELGHFGWRWHVLFEGRLYMAGDLPAAYVWRWFWIVLPPIVTAGAALSLACLAGRDAGGVVALWGAVLFPVLYVIGTRATLYDGVRHLLFIVPALTILATAGWLGLWRAVAPRWRPALALAAGIGIAEPVVFQLRNHPNQTAYVQPLAGGPMRAFARYDLDYWGNCMLAALARIPAPAAGERVPVSGWPQIVLQADLSRFPRLELVEARDPRATVFVTLARGSRQDLLSLDANPDVVDRVVTADGATLCTVTRTAVRMEGLKIGR